MVNIEFVKEAQERYVSEAGDHCPACGHGEHAGEHVMAGEFEEVSTLYVVRKVSCPACKADWFETFKFAGFSSVVRNGVDVTVDASVDEAKPFW